eukprot:g960.t1
MYVRPHEALLGGMVLHVSFVVVFSSVEHLTNPSEYYKTHINLGIPAFSIAIFVKCIMDILDLMHPTPYINLHTGKVSREPRPFTDCLVHAFLFRWVRAITGDGYLYQKLLVQLNKGFMTWHNTYAERGEDAETEVYKFCDRWKIPREPWLWSKKASEYTTPNEWFTRAYSKKHNPITAKSLAKADIATPSTSDVTWFNTVRDMPKQIKNDDWKLDDEVGIPRWEEFVDYPAAIFYLSPQDYHCYHSPISGRISFFGLVNQHLYSVTVKPYIFKDINILRRNRRGVLVIESDKFKGLRVAVVFIGGITVDSLEFEDYVKTGGKIKAGQRVGCFARGGSSIAMMFNRNVELIPEAQKAVDSGINFKLNVGQGFANLA